MLNKNKENSERTIDEGLQITDKLRSRNSSLQSNNKTNFPPQQITEHSNKSLPTSATLTYNS